MDDLQNHDGTVAIALGTNLGDRALNLRSALRDLAPYLTVTAVSPVYETAPVYIIDQPPFLNAALLGTTTLDPSALLWSLKLMEGQLGRQPTFQYGPRMIDLDIIFFGAQIVDVPQLQIPHPRMAEREFVLRPLADIAPEWKHPQTGLTVQQMLDRLPEQGAVKFAERIA